MLGYLTKRLFIFLPTLLIISLIAFTLNNFGAGNPIDARLPPVGEGLDDFNYHEEAYYAEAHRLGLDRPLFYFDFTSAAYPDTLHKIVNRDKIATLKKLIGQYGNWPKIDSYFNQINQLERSIFSWPDTIGKNEAIEIKKKINQLYLGHKEKRISSLLLSIKQKVAELPYATIPPLTDTYTAVEDLQKKINLVRTEPDQAKLFTPVFRWNGFDNQYHNWFSNFIRGDFGVSYFNGQSVTDKIKTAAEWTFIMNIVSLFFTFLLAIPIGVIAAQKQGRAFDRFSSISLFFLFSVPSFWMATMLVMFFTTPQYGMQFFASIGGKELPILFCLSFVLPMATWLLFPGR